MLVETGDIRTYGRRSAGVDTKISNPKNRVVLKQLATCAFDCATRCCANHRLHKGAEDR
jgi:hypothetical protein